MRDLPMTRAPAISPLYLMSSIPQRNVLKRSIAVLATVLVAAASAVPSVDAAEPPRPPVTKRTPVTTEHHGVAITDDYAWLKSGKPEDILEEPETLESPIRAHLEAETAYARAVLAPNRALERRLV